MRVGSLNQTELAKRLRVTQPTVSRWLRGAVPEVDQHHRIVAEARRLGVIETEDSEPTAAQTPPVAPVVRVVGYVGAGGKAHYYNITQGDLDEVPAPPGSTDTTVAAEIRGYSLGRFFDRWIVFWDDVRRPVTADLVGHVCVVGLSDDRVLIKRIRPGTKRGLYLLESQAEKEDPIEDAKLEWAAKVKDLRPR